MLKRIDDLGRIVIPAPFREELGIKLNEYVDMSKENGSIIIKKMDKMLSKDAIEYFYNNFQKSKNVDSDYDKGFEDALKFVLGKGESDENRG